MVKLQLAAFGCIPNFGRQPRKLVMIFIILLFIFTFVTFILLANAVKENDIGLAMVKETDSFSLIRKALHGKDTIASNKQKYVVMEQLVFLLGFFTF